MAAARAFSAQVLSGEEAHARAALSILHNIDLASAFTMSSRVGLHLFQHGAAPRSGLLPERHDLSDADMLLQDASPAAPEVKLVCVDVE